MNTINPYMLFIGCNVPNWLMQSDIVSQGAKLCYGRLCQYSGADGRCFPKKVTLAKDLGVTKSGAWKYIEELKKALLIEEKDGHFVFLYHNLISEESFRRETKVSYRKPEVSVGKPLYNEENQLRESIKDPASLEPSSTKQQINKTQNLGYTPEFEAWWAIYPARGGQKHGKKLALTQFLKIKDKTLIMDATKAYAKSDKATKGYAQDPHRFLKNEDLDAWRGQRVDSKPIVDGFARYNDPNYRLDS